MDEPERTPRRGRSLGPLVAPGPGRAFGFNRMMDHTGVAIGLGAGHAWWLFSSHRVAQAAGEAVQPVDVFRTMYLIARSPAVLSIVAIVFLFRVKAGPSKHGKSSIRAQRSFPWVLPPILLAYSRPPRA